MMMIWDMIALKNAVLSPTHFYLPRKTFQIIQHNVCNSQVWTDKQDEEILLIEVDNHERRQIAAARFAVPTDALLPVDRMWPKVVLHPCRPGRARGVSACCWRQVVSAGGQRLDAASSATTWATWRCRSVSGRCVVPLRLVGLSAALATVQRSIQASYTYAHSHWRQTSPVHGTTRSHLYTQPIN